MNRDQSKFAGLPVVVLTPWFPNTPGEREGNFVYESAQALAALGCAVRVLVSRPLSMPGVSASTSSQVIQFAAFDSFQDLGLVRHLSVPRNMAPGLSDWSLARAVKPSLARMVLRSGMPVVIHAHTEALAPIAVQVASETGARVVVTLHGINTSPSYFAPGRRRRRFGEALAQSDRVVLVGESLRPHFAAMSGRDDHFRVVPNGFRARKLIRDRPALSQCRSIRFVSVSNLHESKGIDDNLRAFAKIRREGHTNWSYTIIGDGYQKSILRRMVRDTDLGAFVRFAGALSPEAVSKELARADVFVLPSSPEAFGIAYLEAMASGCLAIGINGQGPSAFIDDGVSGLLIEGRHGDQLAARLVEILMSPDTFCAMAREGERIAWERFTWAAHAQQLGSVFLELRGPSH
jgi:glycosyltransferase involved in cell wall biosynthesis